MRNKISLRRKLFVPSYKFIKDTPHLHKIDTFIVITLNLRFEKRIVVTLDSSFYAANNSLVHECFVDWQCICINTFWFKGAFTNYVEKVLAFF